jgi:hypothetical protein
VTYRSGYGNGKALGHAMHSEEALESVRASGADQTSDYRRGLEDGFLDGWDAWTYEVSLPASPERQALLHASWDQHLGTRYHPPESEREDELRS